VEEKERYVPGDVGEIWYEHWHRYHFALPLAAGRRVADAACGEGYGSALLATAAKQVTGIDVAADVVAMARRRYGSVPNLEFVEGRCESLPLAPGSIDLLVSFETLEHLAKPETLVAEAARVLGSTGLFVVSTPNKEVYTDQRAYENPHHLKELSRDEFEQALAARFEAVELFAQRVDSYSAIWPANREPGRARLIQTDNQDPAHVEKGLADPMYWIALAGPRALVAEAAGTLSLLSDRRHEVQAGVDESVRQLTELRAYVQRLEAAYLASQEQLAAVARERDAFAARVIPQGATTPAWTRK
jgi:ubiquinone/menaquinone biosynthesis C-methylase UbiE